MADDCDHDYVKDVGGCVLGLALTSDKEGWWLSCPRCGRLTDIDRETGERLHGVLSNPEKTTEDLARVRGESVALLEQ